jgi:hypothetical protein
MKKSELKKLVGECLNEIGSQFRYDVYLNGEKIDTVFASYQDEEEMKHSLINHDGYNSSIDVKLTNPKKDYSNLEEMTGTGSVSGYATPNAFSSSGKQFKDKSKKTAEQLGYKLVEEENESLPVVRRDLEEGKYPRYTRFKESQDVKKHSTKVNILMSEIKKMIKEVNWLTKIGERLKTESGMDSSQYWKRVKESVKLMNDEISEMQERINRIVK